MIARNIITVTPAVVETDLLVASLSGAVVTVWSQAFDDDAVAGPLLASVTLGYSPSTSGNFVGGSHVIKTPAGTHVGPVIVWHEAGRDDLTCIDVDSGTVVSVSLDPGSGFTSVYDTVSILDDDGTLAVLYEYDNAGSRAVAALRVTTDGVGPTFQTLGGIASPNGGRMIGPEGFYVEHAGGGGGSYELAFCPFDLSLGWTVIEDPATGPPPVLGARGPVALHSSGDLRVCVGRALTMDAGDDLPPLVGMALDVVTNLYENVEFESSGAAALGAELGSPFNFSCTTPDSDPTGQLSGNPTHQTTGWVVFPLSIRDSVPYVRQIVLGVGSSILDEVPVPDKGAFSPIAVWAWEL